MAGGFDGDLGAEYPLFAQAVPHHDELQKCVSQIIGSYATNLTRKEVIIFEGGVGTGLTTCGILDSNPKIKVIGIDNEPQMVAKAKSNLSGYADRVTITEDDLLGALKKLPDRSIDVFASAWVIHNLSPEYRQQLFPEIARVLKVGGLFINADKYARGEEDEHQKDLANQLEAFKIFEDLGKPQLGQEWHQHYMHDEKIRIGEIEQLEMLRENGFTDSEVVYRSGMEAIITGHNFLKHQNRGPINSAKFM